MQAPDAPALPFAGMATPRLWLRPFTYADIPTLLAYRNDAEIIYFQGWNPMSEAEAAALVASTIDDQPGTPGQWYQFAIELQSSGAHVGDCGLHTLAADPRQAEIGYTIAPAHQRNGYAAEAAAAVADYTFRVLHTHRLTATLDATNRASAALCERLGMRREAAYVQNVWYHGRYCDEFLYAILAHEWMARHPAPLFRAAARRRPPAPR